MTAARTPTDVDRIADTHVDVMARLDPIQATLTGIAGHDAELPDFTPEWRAAVSAERRRTLTELAGAECVDATDRITVAALRESLEVAEELRATGAEEADLNVIESPLQSIRDVFDLTPTFTVEHWATIATRLAAVPAAVDGYVVALRRAAASGQVSARRQLAAGIVQCEDNIGPDGFFATFAAGAAPDDGTDLPSSLRADLARGAAAASAAYARLQAYLRDDLAPLAPARDAVGREVYALHSRAFLGARVDLAETYEWGQQELARLVGESARTAERITPGASVAEVKAMLDADPARMLRGTAALQQWMQTMSDAAVAALADTHFDIPEPIRTLECRIAPTHSGGMYYTGPSEDLVTRPGRMWWSVPKGVTEFGTWRELTTVYHEGVPGHHLQVAQTVSRSAELNRWRRLSSWISGHGEGWALYAENLMAELGFLDDPADYLGMLDGQTLRAARVVLDIGVHCDFEAPAEVGGGAWDYDKAWRFFRSYVSMPEKSQRFELDRYLGWPGQAPSYKIGERLWLQLREDARAHAGDDFDLAAFHRRALDLGSVGLDVLRDAVLDKI
ncbi:MAG TPA: DUF885 domain-containing protein [Jatrophihabitans sp.]|jgi:uncharacterized protein (DUF885 family)|uniref:DUF885 domain-containing protein n=1 Tax=Jatrophihabitans sp. TaxID=1932789 RepID=UPI002E0C214A|nr:DUF885 domain-containing protein [Jatrophihabitans sp.]